MNILAPHKEQDGWVYLRVRRVPRNMRVSTVGGFEEADPSKPSYATFLNVSRKWFGIQPADDLPPFRTISSRRVEEAVETADYLKRCKDEGLSVTFGVNSAPRLVWGVQHEDGSLVGVWGHGATLREAYYRHAARQ